jgi:hypothetical protein
VVEYQRMYATDTTSVADSQVVSATRFVQGCQAFTRLCSATPLSQLKCIVQHFGSLKESRLGMPSADPPPVISWHPCASGAVMCDQSPLACGMASCAVIQPDAYLLMHACPCHATDLVPTELTVQRGSQALSRVDLAGHSQYLDRRMRQSARLCSHSGKRLGLWPCG